MAQRNYSNISVETILQAGIGSGSTSMIVQDATGWPSAPFIAVIDPDTADEELVIVGGKSGTTFSSLTRAFGGTSAVAHSGSAVVKHVAVAEDFTLIWDHVHSGTGGDETAQVSHGNLVSVGADDHHAQAHVIDGPDHTGTLDHHALDGLGDDDHPQYLNTTRHNAESHAGKDTDAIHDNVAAEIAAITLKGSPHVDDLILLEDSEAGNAKKRATLSSVVSAATTTDHGSLSGLGDDDHPHYAHKSGWVDKGYLMTATAPSVVASLAPGSNNAVLVSDSAQAAGLKWATGLILSSLLPDVAGTRNLGSATKYWNGLYVEWLFDGSGNVMLSTDTRNLMGGGWSVSEGGLSVGGLLHPVFDVTHDLGAVNNTWRRGYINALYDSGGAQRIDTTLPRLIGNWSISGHLDPVSNNAYDLGDASNSWRRLYAYDLYDESGSSHIDLNQLMFHNGTRRLFKMAFALNGSQLRGNTDDDWIEIDSTNSFIQFFLDNEEVFALANGTAGHIARVPGVSGEVFLGYENTPTLAGGVGDFQAYWDDDHSWGWMIGTTASDAKLKENIREFSGDPKALFGVKLRDYEVKATGETRSYLVADEVEEAAPELVAMHDGLKRIRDGQPMQTAIIAALQDLNKRVDSLESMKA